MLKLRSNTNQDIIYDVIHSKTNQNIRISIRQHSLNNPEETPSRLVEESLSLPSVLSIQKISDEMTSKFIPNLFLVTNLVIKDLKESALSIANSKISLALDAVEASNISTSENGGLLSFVNSREINITNICCYSFDTTGNGIFMYITTPMTIQASLLSLCSSSSPKSFWGIYSTVSNFSSLNISKVGRCYGPGLYNYGTGQGKSFVRFHTVADSHTNDNFVFESTYGEQTWTSINGVNCSSPDSIFKDYSANTVMKDGVFAGNWRTSNEKPLVIWRAGGTLKLENVLIQGNGTVSGVSSGYEYSEDPKTIDMVLGNLENCRRLIQKENFCANYEYQRMINFFIMVLT